MIFYLFLAFVAGVILHALAAEHTAKQHLAKRLQLPSSLARSVYRAITSDEDQYWEHVKESGILAEWMIIHLDTDGIVIKDWPKTE